MNKTEKKNKITLMNDDSVPSSLISENEAILRKFAENGHLEQGTQYEINFYCRTPSIDETKKLRSIMVERYKLPSGGLYMTMKMKNESRLNVFFTAEPTAVLIATIEHWLTQASAHLDDPEIWWEFESDGSA